MGKPFANYEILGELGAGGMGVLYRARDTRLQRTVALKRLKPETGGDPERRRRLIQEARSASALNHPHIVTVLVAGGLSTGEELPEVDAFNLAPRVSAPVLMINGRHDFASPLEVSQKPLFQGLGTAAELKRHYTFDGGHVPPRWQEVARETLDWLDRHMGPAQTEGARTAAGERN